MVRVAGAPQASAARVSFASHTVAPPSAAMRAAAKRIIAGPIQQKPQPKPPANPSTDRERLLAAAFGMREVVVYPLSDDLLDDGRVITFRHVRLRDE